MKVLLHHLEPFALGHDGLRWQILQTLGALQQAGMEADFLRWFEGNQEGDVLHFFGRIPIPLLELARENEMAVVVTDCFPELEAATPSKLSMRKRFMPILGRVLPGTVKPYFDWPGFQRADACVALTAWDTQLLKTVFQAPTRKVHLVPPGVEEAFLKSVPATRNNWLVCGGTFDSKSRVTELAQAAIDAKIPLRFIGEFSAESASVQATLLNLVRQNSSMLGYETSFKDRSQYAAILREARGFVRLNGYECIAHEVLEAAACGCPILLSDTPSMRSLIGDKATYVPVGTPNEKLPDVLKNFHVSAPSQDALLRPQSWLEVGTQLRGIYERLLKTSR